MGKNSEKLDIVIQIKELGAHILKSLNTDISKLSVVGGALKTTAVVGIAAVATALYGIKKGAESLIETADAFERMEVKLDALTKGRGVETLEKLNAWALKMPVNTQKAIDTFTMMMAMGLNPTIEKMQTLTDVSVLFGEEAMPRVARALGQMQQLGKLSAEELNQMAEAGINARKYLMEAFGKTVEEIQGSGMAIEQVIDAIWKGLDRDFGGSAAKAQKRWAGMTESMASYWVDFKKQVMDNGVFLYLEEGLSMILAKIDEMQASGELKQWAKDTADAIIDAMETAVTAIGWIPLAFYSIKYAVQEVIGVLLTMVVVINRINPVMRLFMEDFYQSIIKLTEELAASQVETQNQMEAWANFAVRVQSVAAQLRNFTNEALKAKEGSAALRKEMENAAGIAGYKPPLAGPAKYSGQPTGPKAVMPDAVEKYRAPIQDAAAKYLDNLDQNKIASLMAAMIMTESGGNANAVGPPIKSLGGARAKGLAQFIPSTAEAYGIGGQEFDAQASIDAMARYLQDLFGKFGDDIEKVLNAYSGGGGAKYRDKVFGYMGQTPGRERSGDESERLYDQSIKSAASRAQASVEVELAQIDNLYKQNLLDLSSYFDQRRSLVAEKYQAEIAALKIQAAGTDDLADRAALETQIFELEKAQQVELIKLTEQRASAEKDLADKKQRVADILRDINDRARGEAAGNLRAQFDEELAEMDRRQEEEIQRLIDLNATKDQLNEAYRAQQLEKDRLLADQERRIQESRLDSAKQVANGLSEAFTALYEMTGSKQKAFFYLAKAAAMAEAIINVQQGITKALAQGGFWGIFMAATVAAQGAVAIAKISSQKLAEGGLVGGSSPHSKADDKPIMATAGEFMQPVRAVDYYGFQVMEAIRTLRVPKSAFAAISGGNLPVLRPAHAFASGGLVTGDRQTFAKSEPINIINITDPSELDRYLSTSDGQRAILNVLSSRKIEAQRILR